MPYVTTLDYSPTTFVSTVTNVTSGQSVILPGFLYASISIEAGTGYIDGLPFLAGQVVEFGGYAQGYVSATGHNVGVTGGVAHIIVDR